MPRPRIGQGPGGHLLVHRRCSNNGAPGLVTRDSCPGPGPDQPPGEFVLICLVAGSPQQAAQHGVRVGPRVPGREQGAPVGAGTRRGAESSYRETWVRGGGDGRRGLCCCPRGRRGRGGRSEEGPVPSGTISAHHVWKAGRRPGGSRRAGTAAREGERQGLPWRPCVCERLPQAEARLR